MIMKKILLLVLACVCCFTATACAGQTAKPENATESTVSTTTPTTTSQISTTQPTTALKPTETEPEKTTEKTEEKATAPEMEKITEIKPEPTAAKDYSAYLGTWKYKEVPDSIPDEIMNNDTSYKIYMEHLVSTTIEFREINGSTVSFVLYKGNIATVAEANITAEIIDDEIDFDYTDSWNGRGHGTIKLQGDSVYLFCAEDEHGNGRVALNCDNTLTRVEN